MAQRILLVEDNAIAGFAVSEGLIDAGFDVQLVTMGGHVMPSLFATRPDVILLDVTLPDIDGVEVAVAVRERYPTLPIIFTTGHGSYPGLQQQRSHPKTRFIQKPYDISAVTDLIRQLTRRATSSDVRSQLSDLR
jgi:DNA-binding NtrC family response regulator